MRATVDSAFGDPSSALEPGERPMPEPGPGQARADVLCMDCGLCCDGTFFGSVVVAEDERERLARVRLVVVERDGSPVMAQPCSALRGSLCDAYADRPAACATYACVLRKQVSAGTRSLAEARGEITTVRTLLATVRSELGIPESGSIWEGILALEEPPPDEASRYGPAIEAVGTLLERARASFEPAFAGGGRR